MNFGVICIYDTVRFLPSQEWSTCVQRIVGEFGDCVGDNLCGERRQCHIHRYIPVPPVDHSCVGRNLFFNRRQRRSILAAMPNPPVIPRPPVDHSCVGRNLTIMCRQRRRQFRRRAKTMPYSPIDSRPPVDHSCVGRNLTIVCRPVKNRFLPSQEWSTCVQRIVGEFGDCVGDNLCGERRQCHIHRYIPVPPVDHSCVGRNLTIVCRQRRRLLGGVAAL